MLPWDFKILRFACYAQVAASFGMIIWLFYINWPQRFYHLKDILTFSGVILCFVLLAAYAMINIYLLEKKYPNRLPSRVVNILNLVLTVFYLLFYIFIVIGTIALTVKAANSPIAVSRWTFEFLPFVLIWVLTISGISMVYTPVSLRKAIRHNARLDLENFLETPHPVE
jgi:hypothetical protein